ncbi:MAG: translesion DNA synthesis-associated protein ImuA [Proteobacteria bacterium]|nr:translesion DNA synthesis-associated protein ImuA [Pseudomonadota bacterium]
MHSLPAFSALSDILRHGLVWRAGEASRAELPGVPSGFAALDAELPGGGWPTGALTELLPEHAGIGEVRALGPALARLSNEGRWLAWIAPPYLPYAPALEAAGIDLARVMVVRTRSPQDALWAIEQALQSSACGAVLGWPEKASFAQLRRLQIAAEGSPALAFLFRSPLAARESSPAALRLHLQSLKGELAVRILKRRGGPLARPILLTPAPVVEPLRHPVPVTDHAMDRALPAAPAPRILPARLVHG